MERNNVVDLTAVVAFCSFVGIGKANAINYVRVIDGCLLGYPERGIQDRLRLRRLLKHTFTAKMIQVACKHEANEIMALHTSNKTRGHGYIMVKCLSLERNLHLRKPPTCQPNAMSKRQSCQPVNGRRERTKQKGSVKSKRRAQSSVGVGPQAQS